MKRTTESLINVAIVHGQLTHGGSERQLYWLLKACDRQRWQPSLYISGDLGIWEAPIRALGISITLLQGNPIQKMWQFRQLCKAQNIQRFISWGSYTNGYALALAGLAVPCIGSFRNAHFADLPERQRWFWAWLSLAGVSAIICNSQETYAAMRAKASRRQHVLYLPNGVEAIENGPRQRAKWRDQLNIAEHELLVLGVGRLTEQKNFTRFIQAVRIANQTTPVRAVIAGPDMGLRQQLLAQIAAANLPVGTIQLLDAVPDARELMCAADIFMLSSDYEGMPNVVLEAMANGIPCVSTKVNGVQVLIQQGVDGWITDLCEDALAKAVCLLAQDPALRRTFGAKAAARMQKEFTPMAIYEQLWQFCEEQA
ncbi:MAG: glycosyltransferase [Chloroflexi bacterium]|nr:glycosyltransferase [Chloroflexota bacterium]